MADDDVRIEEDGPLTAEDILTFGPVVEAQVWTVSWIQEARAPIAVAAGRPKLGKVFDDRGVGKAVIIRPCISRGRKIRGLSPIYTPKMLEGNAGVFTGWPQYMDHVPAELAASVAKNGRSVKELGGQVLRSFWQQGFVQEGDEAFGYQPGGVLGEVWANEFIRKLVGENPNVLHTSISAWPTSGKPGAVPWKPGMKGMVIEGIRKQPQGSVDYVPRGGAGGRILLAEGEDPDTRAWPVAEWQEEDRRLVVSLADAFYASGEMAAQETSGGSATVQIPQTVPEFKAWLAEHAPNMVTQLREEPAPPAPVAEGEKLTLADVQRLITESRRGEPTADELREQFREELDEQIAERDGQRSFASEAERLIEAAEGVPASWKADLKARYAMRPEGPSPALVIEECAKDDKGEELSELETLRKRVRDDLDHARDLIAEAQGKPRVRGEGAASKASTGDDRRQSGGRLQEGATPYWRSAFADQGIVESEDKALAIHGVETKVEGS